MRKIAKILKIAKIAKTNSEKSVPVLRLRSGAKLITQSASSLKKVNYIILNTFH